MTDGARTQLIAFHLADQAFCVDIRHIREIRGWTAATPLPQAPDYVVGVINLRGAIMPVIDLRTRLGLGRTTPSERHVIFVIQAPGVTAGLLVDAVQETVVVDAADIQPPPAMQGGPGFVDGILSWDGRLLGRLDVARLLPEALAAA